MTPARRLRDIWPTFPVIVMFPPLSPAVDSTGIENIIAALEHRNRISEIHIFNIDGSVLEKLVTVMHEPLPVLAHFTLRSSDESVQELPETLLGRSAPRLQSLFISGVPFTSFPKFIICFTHIGYLHLVDIPDSGCISPDVMATCLTTCPNLKSLSIGFRSPLSRPLQIRLPPLKRAVLPALTRLSFCGVSEYFEDFVSRIDTPLLNQLIVSFFMDLIFDIPRLRDFIDRTTRLGPFSQVGIEFSDRAVKIVLGPSTPFELEIRCERRDWQLSSMTQIFSHQLPFLSYVEQLEICESPWRTSGPGWNDDLDVDSSQWLELFYLFIAVQNLRVSKGLVPPVANALQQLTGRTAIEALPALRDLFLEEPQPSGPVHDAMGSFVAARQLSDHPVVLQRWEPQRPYLADIQSQLRG